MLLHAVAVGFTTSSISCYFPYLKQEIGLDYTQTSLIATVRSITSTVVLLFSGKYYTKIGLRLGASFACIAAAASFLLLSIAEGFGLVIAASVLAGVSYGLGSMLPIAIAINRWFKHSGTFIAIAACGSSISMSVVPNAMVAAFERGMSLSSVLQYQAVVCVLASFVIFGIMRESPEAMGISLCETSLVRSAGAKAIKPLYNNVSLSRSKLRLLIFAAVVLGCVTTPYHMHISLHYTATGFDPVLAAAAFSVIGVSMLVGKFGFGLLSDRFDTRLVNYIFFGTFLIACAMELLVNKNSPAAVLYVATFLSGIGISLGTVGLSVWTSDMVPARDYEQVMARVQFFFSLGTSLYQTVPGILADLSGGTYRPAFMIFAVMILLCCSLIQYLYRQTKGL